MGNFIKYLIIYMLMSIAAVKAGKVLLYPYGHGFTSRLMDVLKMGIILRDSGHEVAVLVNDQDQKHFDKLRDVHFHVFPAPSNRVTLIEDESLKSSFMNSDNSTTDTMTMLIKRHLVMCEQLLKSKELLAELKEAKYELIIVDVADNCGRIVSQALDIPTMPYSSTGLIIDHVLFPNLPSFVPAPMSSFTSDMTFWQRVQNTALLFIIDRILSPFFFNSFEDLQSRYNLTATARLNFRKAYVDQLYLVHTDFALEDPRPLLPNVVLIGGMFVPEANSLEASLEEFMDGAGEAGVVVVSFGSLIKQMDPVKARAIARALAKLQQRVIWRYDGAPPAGVGSNTLLLPWLPQTDLLAHSQTRLFVTHCGIHGTYETAKQAVPVVAVPLMFDQHANSIKLVKRAKMGVFVDFKSLTEDSFLNGMREVLQDPKYRENARMTSQMMQDHALTPKERFLFWVGYVIRNKGIGKLALEPLKTMDTFQLYCVDVYLFLLAVTLGVFGILIWSVKLCCRCCGWKKTNDKLKSV